MIIDDYMLRGGRKKFNIKAFSAGVIVLLSWVIPVFLAFTINPIFILLGFGTWFVNWVVYECFTYAGRLSEIKRNYKFVEIHKPKDRYGLQIVGELATLQNDYEAEVKMLGGADALFEETMDFLVAYDNDSIRDDSDKDIKSRLKKIEEILELCKRERARAEEERRKMLGRETRSDVIDSMLTTARKEYR